MEEKSFVDGAQLFCIQPSSMPGNLIYNFGINIVLLSQLNDECGLNTVICVLFRVKNTCLLSTYFVPDSLAFTDSAQIITLTT
jgi:hypothetical protein